MPARTVVPGLLGACLSIVASAAPGTVAASFCGTPSPALVTLGDAYFEPDAEPRTDLPSSGLERRDPRRPALLRLGRLLERLYRAELAGGHGERTVCQGVGDASREIVWTFDLEQLERVATLNGGTLLAAFESRHTVRATPPERRLADATLVAEIIDLPPRWYADANAATLLAERRSRHVAAGSDNCATNCAYLGEVALSARAIDGGVELERTRYVNGIGSERTLWRLDWRAGS